MKVLRREGHPDLVVPEETVEQQKLFTWVKHNTVRFPQLGLMYAIPNGGSRHLLEAVKMKAEGVMAGVPDTNLPWPNDTHAGLFIELKRVGFALVDRNPTPWGTISTDQLKWMGQLQEVGHHAVVCRGCEHAARTIEAYCLDDERWLAHLNQWWVDLDPALLAKVTKKPTAAVKKRPRPRGFKRRARVNG